MTEENFNLIERRHPYSEESYPSDLAAFVRDRWNQVRDLPGAARSLPDAHTLKDFLSTCYHASMLREETRAVTFRAIFAPPSLFAPDGMAPESLLRLDFTQPLRFSANVLRRLSVAADPQRMLIGVYGDAAGGLDVWGLINSGTRWLRDVQGGRRSGPELPLVPVVRIDSPGSIEVHKGYELIGKLQGGRLSGSRVDLFESKWLPNEFTQFRDNLLQRHAAARKNASDDFPERWASLEPNLPRRISERMMKRVIAMLREAQHGGTILLLPVENPNDLSSIESFIDLKYRFSGGQARRSFPDLLVDILNRLAQVHAGQGHYGQQQIGWRAFEESTDDELATLDEALFETAHLIAGLAAVDGAVLLSKNHDLLGFGGMISGMLPSVRNVARAGDIEGETIIEEEVGNVGTRHQSAYRLVKSLPGSIAIVISQDGDVRFVCHRNGRVTYWEQE